MQTIEEYTIDELIERIEKKAREASDGHYTVFKFTTHYKAAFGTPSSPYACGGLRSYPTYRKALEGLLLHGVRF